MIICPHPLSNPALLNTGVGHASLKAPLALGPLPTPTVHNHTRMMMKGLAFSPFNTLYHALKLDLNLPFLSSLLC